MAVDIGSESGRVFAGYIRDDQIFMKEIYRFKTQFMPLRGGSVRNIYRYHEEIIHALKIYRELYGERLDSIGVDSWGGDFVLLDREGRFSSLPASYRITSSSDDVKSFIQEKIGLEELYRHTGNQGMPTDTLSQLIRMMERKDPAMDEPCGILFMGDAYHYMLGAKKCCEHSLASYSRMYDNRKNEWDREIMEKLGIPKGICTPVVYAGERIGSVDRQILREAEIHGDVQIIAPCVHDTACAALTIPDLGDDWLFISSGTWSLMGTETEKPIIDDLSYSYNLSNSSMPLKTNMLKKNIQGMWVIQQCRQAWKEKYSYAQLADMAGKLTDNDWYIDVDREEFYAPENMPAAICSAIRRDYGVEISRNDFSRISRICFESLALKYRYYSDKLILASGKKISKIYILGGGSYNDLLNQMTANATGLPVYTGIYEGSSTGNLLLQAYGMGEAVDKEHMRRIVCNSFQMKKFEPMHTNLWNRKYDSFEKRISHEAQW